jgi:hypothetical protein
MLLVVLVLFLLLQSHFSVKKDQSLLTKCVLLFPYECEPQFILLVVLVLFLLLQRHFSVKKDQLFFSYKEHYSPNVCCCSHVNVNHSFTRSCR